MKTFSLFISLFLLVYVGMAQMPAAITIEPASATAYDTLTLIFDPAEACVQSGSLAGLDSIAIHSGVTYQDGPSWQCVIGFDEIGLNGQSTILYPTDDGRFSITYVPFEFYGFPNGAVVTEICAVFNNGTNWNQDGRDFEDEFTCMDFFIPIAHSCLPQDITFTTQEQIDNFQIDHPYCTEIEGDVTIFGANSITNLDSLIVLTSIGGNLNIGDILYDNYALQNISGLNNLSFVGGSLNIINNIPLVELNGLNQVTYVGGALYIEGNPELINLNGLNSLTHIGNGLSIISNNSLINLEGFESLEYIGGSIGIIYNDNLESIYGLESITNISEDLGLYYNDKLENLEGFNNLVSIGRDFFLLDNNNIKNLEGLNNLNTIGGSLGINGNDSLSTLTALESLESVNTIGIGGAHYVNGNHSLENLNGLGNINAGSVTSLYIKFNSQLTKCDIKSICEYLASPDALVEIDNNASGCSTVEEVEEACSSCLPEGITFYTQDQIDNFQTDYPGCTEIEGDVEISGDNITNLNGLNTLTSIGGNLDIGKYGVSGNPALVSLTGLDNLVSVGGRLVINYANVLTSLTGLEELSSIGGSLFIGVNDSLTSFSGFENLASIGQNLTIHNNNSLMGLTGLESLESIGGNLSLFDNNALVSLAGLNNVHSIGGDLVIGFYWDIGGSFYCAGNSSLKDIGSLSNLTSITGDLRVSCNSSLTDLSGLHNISVVGGDLVIVKNDSLVNLNQLGSLDSIQGDLMIGILVGESPIGNSFLTNLSGLDNLNYIGGNTRILGNNSLANLTGLENVTSIDGYLEIWYNNSLTNLSGLDNVTSIGGSLGIYHNTLTSLTGLDNVSSIGGGLGISANDSLTNLSGLENLTTIGGGLFIYDNNALTSLAELNNVDAGSITNLKILGNPLLSACASQSICDYLVSPNGEVEIHDNAEGCNNQLEVEEACASFVNDLGILFGIKTQPNPFTTTKTIEYELKQPEKVLLTIYDYLGKQVYQTQENQSQGKQQLIWNAEAYADGVYYYRLKAGDKVANGKMVKVR